jgi:hypothetical protein
LSKPDQYNLSLSNKEQFNRVSAYWYDLTSLKLENINSTFNYSKKRFENVLGDYSFQLSPSTNAAFKILNNSKYLEPFAFDNIHNFENPNLLQIYRLLFQFTKIFDNNLKQDNKQYINTFTQFLRDKNNLGEYMKSIAKSCDFSPENIEKVKEIYDFYQIKTIDCGAIGKQCRTTGIIAFFVKDALVFCGIDNDKDKKPKDAKQSERVTLIKDNSDLMSMKLISESIMKKLSDLDVKLSGSSKVQI